MVSVPQLPAPTPLRLTIGARPVQLSERNGRLVISTASGEELSQEAADVLLALGGDEPEWLWIVDGLEAVYEGFGYDEDALARAAAALGQGRTVRPRTAKHSSDVVQLIALAASGHHQVALNPKCTAVCWDLLSAHRRSDVRSKTLQATSTLPESLAGHSDPVVRRLVAANRACSKSTLAKLARDDDWRVRTAVAANPASSQETLDALACSGAGAVTRIVVRNASTSRYTLRRLSRSPDPQIRGDVVANANYPVRAARWKVFDRSGIVRTRLAGRPDVGLQTLRWIERYARRDPASQYRMTRWAIRQNPACNDKLRGRLDDIEEAVRQQAKERGPSPQALVRPWWLASMTAVATGVLTVLVLVLTAVERMSRDPVAGLILLAVAAVVSYATCRLVKWIGQRSGPRSKVPRAIFPAPRHVFPITVGAFFIVLIGIFIRGNPTASFLPIGIAAKLAYEAFPSRKRSSR